MTFPPSPALTLQQREEILTAYLQREAKHGWRVQQRHAASATVDGPMVWVPIWLTLLLLPVTCGTWALVARLLQRRGRFRQVWVDEQGQVHVQAVARGI